MGMDALTNAAIESLLKDVLPRLQEQLQRLVQQPSGARQPDLGTDNLLLECFELLTLMRKWTNPTAELNTPAPTTSSADEMTMLADMADLAPTEATTPAEPESDHELSDEEAMALMGLDADATTTADAAPEPELAPPKADDEEMNDDEAMRLLAEMDSPTATVPAPEPVPAKANDEEMNDDEAMRLLAEMDAPAAAAPASAKADSEEMNDDEAMRLLAEMDAPAPAPKPAPAAKAAPAPVAKKSAEDEAASLLAQFGGDDDEPVVASAPTPAAAAPMREGAHSEAQEEAIEWEANDFQNDPDMLADFNNNTEEIMTNLDETILRLEQNPSDKEIIEEIFRGAHTLKGAAGMFGYRRLEKVMHRTENLFDLIRKGKLHANSDVIDVVLQALDVMRTLLTGVKNGKQTNARTVDVIANLEAVTSGKAIVKTAKPTASAAPKASAPTGGGSGGGDDHGGGKADKKGGNANNTIRVDLDRLDALVNLVGELVIDRTRFASIEEELRTRYPHIKLEGNFSETVQLFGRHMNDFQDIIMKVRMVPIGNAFNKFSRLVRDIAKSVNKKIDLHISGESAELDKTLVEQIGDPLIHLVRNSCDHGIETPEDRIKKGKSATGNIYLSAHQEGNNIVIKIEDDGKGIPADIVRRKAVEKGLIKEEDKLSEREIFNLIFEPGFSTAEKVTNLSGRGVGMDVVKKQIMKLKGMLDIESAKDRGTTITIRLPLTLAIVQSLLVQTKSETFAIPLGSVIESLRISPKDIQRVGDLEVIKLRDKVLPLLHLEDALNLTDKDQSLPALLKRPGARPESRRSKTDKHFVVIVGTNDRPFGVVVDQLLNQQEMVIKSMGRLMQRIPCVAGGAVLGNGEVVLVLDVPELQEAFKNKSRSHAA